MAVIKALISSIMAALMAAMPTLSVLAPSAFEAKEDGILLNVSVVSDTHLDEQFDPLAWFLALGLKDMSRAKTPVDVVAVTGDLTNYGDEGSIDQFFDTMEKNWDGKAIIAMGNHDIGHVEDKTHEEARQYFVEKYNEYQGLGIEKSYYSTVIEGYTFIVLTDESDDSWDHPDLYQEQLDFLDAELAKSGSDDKPVFVICHWPLAGTHGEEVAWDDGDIGEPYSTQIQQIVEKYENVFFISGHIHIGLNGNFTREEFGVSSYDRRNGVNYLNLPSYGLLSRYGTLLGGRGYQIEVYEDKVILRARNYVTHNWFNLYETVVELD
ncbi:MAG: metallophosphoesterase [Clostridia bacterium]|nr:metallophosphoesterase [Clostridia bacterium]